MGSRTKRKPDLRRIRPTKTYTLPDIARVLARDIKTVRGWVRRGLPTLDDRRPPLVLGADLLAWLKDQWLRLKQKCGPNELFCCRCRIPRLPRRGSVSLKVKNARMLSIKGLCDVCGCRMNRDESLLRLEEVQARFGAFMPEMQRLEGYGDSADKDVGRRPHFKEATDGLVPDVVEAEIIYAGSSP